MLTLLVVWVRPADAASAVLPDPEAIETMLQGDSDLALDHPLFDRAMLAALYEKRDFQPIWNEQRTQSFTRALEEAASHGLDAGVFAVTASGPVERELVLTDAFLRYASALARGRVRLADVEADWRIPSPPFDAAKVLDAALAGDVGAVLDDLAPQAMAYRQLRAALQYYRELAKTGWHALRTITPLRPGDSGDEVHKLRARLAAEGFIAASEGDPSVYDEALTEAVARFQAARGLSVDGAAGKQTLVSLNVSPAARVRQIRWNLERWRSLPRLSAATRIEVNAAAAMAVLYQDHRPVKTMRAIVGAVAHPTPVLRARLNSLLLNPPWNVPSSIIEHEIRPMMKTNPRYLRRAGLVYVELNGARQLVQLPGPKNALGQIKFEMPNSDDIYLHDTPDRRLFTSARSALSHGCVRVEDPRDLALLVLDSADWSPEALDRAIATGQTQSVALQHAVPVYLLYWTAFVDPDGTVEFRDDLYGRDRRLGDAVAAQDAAEQPVATGNYAKKG